MIKLESDPMNSVTLMRISSIAPLTQRAIRHGFFAFAKDLHQTANKEILRRPKSGRTYIVRGPSGARRRHVASAPGETHANLTGKLRRSIGWQVHGGSELEFGYGVGPEEGRAPDYAHHVEYGTPGGQMKARPSLRNAIGASMRNAEVHFANAIIKELA